MKKSRLEINGFFILKTIEKPQKKIVTLEKIKAMTKRAMNLYEFIFSIFFLLKITHQTNVSEWNWFWVFLPLIINFIWKFFSWIVDGTGMRRDITNQLADFYVEKKVNQKLKKFRDEIKQGS